MKTIELLNYEGPVLQLAKADSLILIDQWQKPIAKFTSLAGLIAFLNGDVSISDSVGKTWTFTNHSSNARTNFSDIINFAIND